MIFFMNKKKKHLKPHIWKNYYVWIDKGGIEKMWFEFHWIEKNNLYNKKCIKKNLKETKKKYNKWKSVSNIHEFS